MSAFEPARRPFRGGIKIIVPIATLGIALVPSAGSAHDFWIQPTSYCVSPGAVTPLSLQVGHGADRQRSSIPISRVTRFEAAGPQVAVVDLRSQLRLARDDVDGRYTPAHVGTHVLALETDHAAQSHLTAERFNAYLREEGLTPALAWRDQAGRSNTQGSETYGRVAKALIQSGPSVTGSPDGSLRPVGLTLEIVPEINPYLPSRPPRLPFRVFYRGAPLAGALVKLTDLDDDAHPRARHLTDSDGRVAFTIPRTGQWQLNVVWTRRQPPDHETEFETTFSSLTFGCRAGTAEVR